MEMSCDEKVLNNLGTYEKENYSLTLLSFARKNPVSVLAFGENNAKDRILNILNYRKPSL